MGEVTDSPIEIRERPTTWGECKGLLEEYGWCPYVGCHYHLYMDVQADGSMKFNFPDLDPWELPACCTLQIAELGGCTLEEVGLYRNHTRERARQIETTGLRNFIERVCQEH